MMQNIYPLFERNRVLKKELLWSMRDYSFSHVQLEYQEYGQGILRGCEVSVKGDQLLIGAGMVKYGQFICLLMEETQIPYQSVGHPQYLKMRIEIDRRSADYILYQIEFVLEESEKKQKNEFEVCRFNLKKGAQLRGIYTGFEDMATAYDTVNLIHSDWSGLKGKSLAPAITRRFAEAVLSEKNSLPEDDVFAYMCLNQNGAIAGSVLADYLSRRTGEKIDVSADNSTYFNAFCAVLEAIRQGNKKSTRDVGKRHTIIVD